MGWTEKRINRFAAGRKDLGFQRGESAYDRMYSDPKVKPNPNLGALTQPSFYGVRRWAGDLGTKGGLLTDECARTARRYWGCTRRETRRHR